MASPAQQARLPSGGAPGKPAKVKTSEHMCQNCLFFFPKEITNGLIEPTQVSFMKPFKIYENFRKMTRKNASNIYEVTNFMHIPTNDVMRYLCIVWGLITGVLRWHKHKNKRLRKTAPVAWRLTCSLVDCCSHLKASWLSSSPNSMIQNLFCGWIMRSACFVAWPMRSLHIHGLCNE